MDTDPTATLHSFDTSLDTLEATLAPLLARPLNETREALGGIERAKLDVLVAYAVNNLVWSEFGRRVVGAWKGGEGRGILARASRGGSDGMEEG